MLTIIAENELVFYSIDSEWFEVLSLVDELQRNIGRIKQTLSIQCLEIDDLEAIRTPDTQLGLQEVYRARLQRDVELLESISRIVFGSNKENRSLP